MKLHAAALISAALALSGCSMFGGEDGPAPSRAAQEAAIDTCIAQFGINEIIRKNVTIRGSQTIVTVKPLGTVTQATADQINACAARQLGTSSPTTAAATASARANPASLVPLRSGDRYSALTVCRSDLGVLQGGVAICPLGQR